MPTNDTAQRSAEDWNEEWMARQIKRRHFDDAEAWTKRSKDFHAATLSDYARRFLELAAIRDGETVFDMGCGSGMLAVPLAQDGHKVVAADFSQGMLDETEKRIRETGVTTVFPKLMSWEDDWPSLGVREGMVDVCIASRSIATADLLESLRKLDTVARRRVCITLSTHSSPRIDPDILSAIGLHHEGGVDFRYALNMLLADGILPTLDYIRSLRKDTYDSADDAMADFSRMIADVAAANDPAAVEKAPELLAAWLDDNLVENEEVGKPDGKGRMQKALRLREARVVEWAFIAWNK